MANKYQIIVDMNPEVKGPNKTYTWEIKSLLEDGEWSTVATGTAKSAHDAFEDAESKHLMLVCRDACREAEVKKAEGLDEEDRKIWDMWCNQYGLEEIAHEVGLTIHAVKVRINAINQL